MNFIDIYYLADTIICEDFEGDTSKSSQLSPEDWKNIGYIQKQEILQALSEEMQKAKWSILLRPILDVMKNKVTPGSIPPTSI